MMNYIWGILMILSVVCALMTGRINQLSDSVLTGAAESVKFVISILGMMAFWTGIMKIAEESKVTDILAKILSPILKVLFKEKNTSSSAFKAICMNITANLLGLGNAATPFGIKAMKEMQKSNPHPDTATNSMIMFIIVNTASLQLIPTFLCALRQQHGAENPLNILPILWVTSVISLIVGVCVTKIFEKAGNNNE